MESAQLLLEVSLALYRWIDKATLGNIDVKRHAVNCLLPNIIRNQLFGIDRSPLAKQATQTVFQLFCIERGLPEDVIPKIRIGNSLELVGSGEFQGIDAIVNNPPWGEMLSTADNVLIKSRCTTSTSQLDTYIAFAELGMRALNDEGIYAFILPSQALATHNARLLRSFLIERTDVQEMVLLPRAAFATATVRGLVVVGRIKKGRTRRRCMITSYSMVYDLNQKAMPRQVTVDASAIDNMGSKSWWSVFRSEEKTRLKEAVSLERVGAVVQGAELYRLGHGIPPQTKDMIKCRLYNTNTPAKDTVLILRGRDVRRFYVRDLSAFARLGPWLAYVGRHQELRHELRVVVRELCSREGWMTAAVLNAGSIPLHGVITIIPHGINPHVLVAILNSGPAAAYVRRHTASFSKVDFQKITINELRGMPIPLSALSVGGLLSKRGHKSALRVRRRLAATVRALEILRGRDGIEERRLRRVAENLVEELFELI
jgi:hypothetical protein